MFFVESAGESKVFGVAVGGQVERLPVIIDGENDELVEFQSLDECKRILSLCGISLEAIEYSFRYESVYKGDPDPVVIELSELASKDPCLDFKLKASGLLAELEQLVKSQLYESGPCSPQSNLLDQITRVGISLDDVMPSDFRRD